MGQSKRTSGFLTWGGRVPRGPSHHCGAKNIRVRFIGPTAKQREFARVFQAYLRVLHPESFMAYRRRDARRRGRQVPGVPQKIITEAIKLTKRKLGRDRDG